MPQDIYNEGRVVGFSAWELYKRQALSNGVPENEIPDEREWIASMIGSGASMVLKIRGDSGGFAPGVHDYILPMDSQLTAAGVIIATPFIGDCEFEGTSPSIWAKKVNSYGDLIRNDNIDSPTSQYVPYRTRTDTYKDSVSEYLKITDGIVYTKYANWINRSKHRTEHFTSTGAATIELDPSNTVIGITSVTVDGAEVSSDAYSYDDTTHILTFTEVPPAGVAITVKYDEVDTEPAKDIDPNFNGSTTVVRLYFSQELNHEVSILFTGFANKRILQGLSGYAHDVDGYAVGGSTDADNNDWVNGGLLGPEMIPWASKIVFTVPNYSYSVANDISRIVTVADGYFLPDEEEINIDGIKFYGNAAKGDVHSGTVIDFNSINLTDYYTKHPTTNTLQELVQGVSLGPNGSISNLVAWYPGMTGNTLKAAVEADPPSAANFFPPALYAAKITDTGYHTLIPLDTAAPGTVKVFKSAKEASDYRTLMPDNYAMYYNRSRLSYSYAIPGLDSDYWPGSAQLHYDDVPAVTLIAGGEETKLISLMSPDHVPYATTGSAGNIPIGPTGNPTWQNLLQALPNNYALDVLGPALHTVGSELENNGTIGHSDTISDIKATSFTVAGSYPVSITTSQNNADSTTNLATLQANQAYKSGTNFIEFSNGLRLYVSETEPDPTNVPVGSIGIGWTGDSVSDEIISENPPIEGSDSRPAMGG